MNSFFLHPVFSSFPAGGLNAVRLIILPKGLKCVDTVPRVRCQRIRALSGGAKSKEKNPRYSNGGLRRKYRARFKAMDAPCGICGGKLGAIRYDQPSDFKHPLSFVIDEIIPGSRYIEGGYGSKREAAEDWNNLQAAHWICNARKSNKNVIKVTTVSRKRISLDGEW